MVIAIAVVMTTAVATAANVNVITTLMFIAVITTEKLHSIG
jgi:hypothetical protein